MTELRTDEEQAEALKKWWADKGIGVVTSIAVVAAGWFGWGAWQNNQQQTGEAASAVYSQLVELSAQPIASQDAVAKAEMQALAEQLKSEYSSTTYADFGSLFIARFAVDAGDYDSAVTELSALIARADEGPIKYTAQARLAAILVQQEKLDDALAIVANIPDPAYAPQFEETRGDALFLKGDKAAAREAYLRALAAAQELGINHPALQRKADSLAIAGDA
jgi:predicted negative regulator of RcsB-dependent stress response